MIKVERFEFVFLRKLNIKVRKLRPNAVYVLKQYEKHKIKTKKK